MKRTNMMNLVFVLRSYMKHLSLSPLHGYDLFKWFWINCSAFILCYWCAEHVFVFIHVFPHHTAKVQTRNIVNGCIKFPLYKFFYVETFFKANNQSIRTLAIVSVFKDYFWRWRMCGKEFVSSEVLKLEIKTFTCKDDK